MKQRFVLKNSFKIWRSFDKAGYQIGPIRQYPKAMKASCRFYGLRNAAGHAERQDFVSEPLTSIDF